MLAAGSAAADMAGDAGDALGRHPAQETLLESIKRLKDQQAAMKAAKVDVQRQLKNATKRRQRLKKQARQLTDKDLVEVLQMRKDAIPAVVVGEPTAAAALNDEVVEDAHMSD
jgi:flagellar motility protein MotE (MotC chaperone)